MSASLLLASPLLASLLAGCGSGGTVRMHPPPVFNGVAFSATVKAGAAPAPGAAVVLYAVGTGGNGSAATLLENGGAAADSSGNVTLPANYSCPSAATPVYLISTGGTVNGTDTVGTVLMAAIGPCSSIATATHIVINEVTTVAAAYALAPFSVSNAGGAFVSSSSTNIVGIANAFLSAAELADVTTGSAPGPMLPANALSPAARVNTVANLLNACIVTPSVCTSLYTAVSPQNAPVTNTLDAAFAIAKQPGASTSRLFALSTGSAAFTPALTSSPKDLTMFLVLSGGGMSQPTALGVDSGGNVWVASYNQVVSRFSPSGAPVFASGLTGFGLNETYGMAVDPNDNAWVANQLPPGSFGSVSVFTPEGTSKSGANGFTAGNISYPQGVAIDTDGTVWVANYEPQLQNITVLNSAGNSTSGPNGYSSELFLGTVAVAIDGNHFGWLANSESASVVKVARDGSSFTSYPTDDLLEAVAVDQGNNVWVANYFKDSISVLSNGGTSLARGITGAGSIYHPGSIAIDGLGNAWIGNVQQARISAIAGAGPALGNPLTPGTGLGLDAGLTDILGMAVDASGSLWATNKGPSTLLKFIGLAAPVKTPLNGIPKLP